ncbi:MAG TPA: hypothetical protein VEU96_18765 [Bryobacteraceae bacterium]|nr:hypothetical protein [Bryobacteraceae bacterium]
MRQGALGAALVHGLLYTIPGIIGWAPVLRADVYEISSFGGITLADNIIGWFNQQSSKIVIQFWDVVGIFWQVTIVLLLIALSRCRGTLPESDARPSRLLRKVAVLAAITSGLALIIDIGGTVHWVANLDKSQSNWFPFTVPTMGQVIFRSTINMIPELCRLAVAVIVYRSLPTYASVPVERPLDSPNP